MFTEDVTCNPFLTSDHLLL